jgi:hypothetical protein
LLVIFIGAGFAYVYFSGDSSEPTKTEIKEPEKIGPPKPAKPNPKNPVGASVVSIISPVKAGSNSSITIKTTPTAICAIKVVYGKVSEVDSGLRSKMADDFGNATWSWTVDKAVTPGKGTAKVACTYAKKSGYVEGYFEVK